VNHITITLQFKENARSAIVRNIRNLLKTKSTNWWRRLDSNQRPTDYETVALAT
jgi:hypothetical protein